MIERDPKTRRPYLPAGRTSAAPRPDRWSPSPAARRLLLLAALLAAVLFDAAAQSSWSVEPAEWDFGRIPDTAEVHREVTVENRGNAPLQVRFIPTCDCTRVEPAQANVPAGGKSVFRLTLDPAGYSGEVEKDFMVRFTGDRPQNALFRVYGVVLADETASAPPPAASPPALEAGGVVRVDYYHSPGCRDCERFLAQELPAIAAELGVEVDLRRADIFEPAVYEEYRRLLEELGEEERVYPALRVGTVLLQGEREIETGLRGALTGLASPASTPASARAGAKPLELAVLPVLAAGLLDGINPCAFTTLIFLVSALAVAGRGRRDILIIGAFFALSVFASYFLIGLGFLHALRLASSFSLIAALIKWLLVGVLLVFAALSLYDYALIRRGRATAMLLQLPSSFKRRIHDSVRTRVRSTTLVASTLVMGFLVAVFELACTGQVYLPTIAYLVRTERRLADIFYLLLYNLGFIAPLLAVFALSFAGLTSEKLAGFFRRSVGAVKLGLALLFLVLAALTLLT